MIRNLECSSKPDYLDLTFRVQAWGSLIQQAHFSVFVVMLYFNNAGTGITSVARAWNLYMNNGVAEKESTANVQTRAYPYAASKSPYTNTLKHLGSWWRLT